MPLGIDLTDATTAVPERSRKRGRSRARVTDQHALPPEQRGREAYVARVRELERHYLTDVGGIECCSYVKLTLLRRLAAVTAQSERLEMYLAGGEGGELGITQLCQLASTALRLASRIGLERGPRNIGPPSVDAYLAKRNGNSESDDFDVAEPS